MSLRNSLIVYRKELRDMLRDKRTIRSMFVIPVVAFPLLFLIVGYVQAHFAGQAQKEVATIMVQGGEDSPKVMGALRNFASVKIIPYRADAKQEVSDKTIRALVQIPKGLDASISNGHPERISIGYYQSDEASEIANTKLESFFDDYRDSVARAALAARGVPTSLLEPFTVESTNIAPPSKVGAAMFGGLIPYFIIIFCFTGAMYPAMDLTAGEKERGTMETILSSPVSRTDLVFGKFLMIVTASVVTAVLSILSLGFSFAHFKNSIVAAAGSSLQFSIDPGSVAAVIVLILPLAVLFAAGLLAVALLAKSYREAQTYVSPLVFIVIVPAMIGTIPGVELNWKTALIPILNTCMVSKEIISGTYHWTMMAAVFGMTCLYAALGLAAAVRMFNREDVLFRT
ncbi:MAG TPA: ABC transporter permease [Candidatus Acidoferrales bacterium]|nr:ABC transporter permease [Candidatus Acidoferrales bacterium]